MRGKGLTAESIIDAAFELMTEKGFGNYTVRDLAVRLNVKAASLYNHIGSVEKINQEIGKRAAVMMNDALMRAIDEKEKEDSIEALAYAYRSFAQEKPELYRAIISLPSLGESEDLRMIGRESFQAFRQITNHYQIPRETGVHFSRCYRSALHGFVSLMQSGYYANKSVDPEKSFRFLICGYTRWLGILEQESILQREGRLPNSEQQKN